MISVGFVFGLTVLCTLQAQADQTPELTLLLNRDAQNTELYFALPAKDLAPVLGADAKVVFSQRGTAPLSEFRIRGSADKATLLIDRLTIHADGLQLGFDAMSLMVHPETEPQPFQTPWDAVVATSVCASEEPDAALTSDNSLIYLAIFSSELGAGQGFAVTFPQTGRAPYRVVLREFLEGKFVAETTHDATDGRQIRTPAAAPFFTLNLPSLSVLGSLGVLALCVGSAIQVGSRRARDRRSSRAGES